MIRRTQDHKQYNHQMYVEYLCITCKYISIRTQDQRLYRTQANWNNSMH